MLKQIHKFLFFSIAFFLFTESLNAQGKFEFKETTHDFGAVTEGNQASHEFAFKNTGDQPIIIQNVRASCGCTTPYWTREPVLPGQEGKIKASYNSKGRPGVFNKTITITSNATEPSKRLTIKGNVIREPEKPKYTEEDLAISPIITIDQIEFNMGKVEKGQSVTKKLQVTNEGKSNLRLRDLQSSCNCVTVLNSPEVIEPGETASLELKITPRVIAARDERIYIFSNDLKNPKTDIVYFMEVVDDLSGMSIMQQKDNSNPFK